MDIKGGFSFYINYCLDAIMIDANLLQARALYQ